MLTKLTIRNFKRFGPVEIELGSPVVFIGPNNSGKTSAMQALALWDIGVKRWNEKRAGKSTPEKRPGVTVNRKDLLAIPHPSAKLLWRQLRIRDVQLVRGHQRTNNVRIEIVVEGITGSRQWACGLEFDYANDESFYCRPLRLGDNKTPERMAVPDEAAAVDVALLPPMSGLATTETRLDQGAINVRVGEGRTAEVLRNLCYRVLTDNPGRWGMLVEQIERLFGAVLNEPRYVEERGEVTMGYSEQGSALDLSSSGRGLQQTLLILAYMYANPGAVILLDEPDAHLEILRQRQIYDLIVATAADQGNQIVAASHSEILLNEAAQRHMVIAFVGQPHRLGDGGSQVQKSLSEIGFDHYSQAEQTGWVLYVEGATDLSILRALARRLNMDDVARVLERPFVEYVQDQPSEAKKHFYGLKEAVPHLKAVALYDRLARAPAEDPYLMQLMWERREIENYLCSEATLMAWVLASVEREWSESLFQETETRRRIEAMRFAIGEVSSALATFEKGSPWSNEVKASDDVLKPIFRKYFELLGLPNLMDKSDFHELAAYVPESEIDDEICGKLSAILDVAKSARPAVEF